jgi:hypothetical protein
MRRLHRVVMLAMLLALAPALAGCENFDPDKLDFLGLNKKKPLPGDRKPLFPEGVPGVSQGIPPEYLKGNEQEQTGAAVADTAQMPPGQAGATPGGAAQPNAKTAAVEPAAEAKPKAQPKPKRHIVKRAPVKKVTVKPVAAQQPQQQQQLEPWPATQQQPAPPAQSPWPAPAQSSTAPWPSAPAPGTFSK